MNPHRNKALQHGLTHPLSPAPPSPRVWLGDWEVVTKVKDDVYDERLVCWGIK